MKKNGDDKCMENEKVQFDKVAEEYDENLRVLLERWGGGKIPI